jgi:chemotaxis protein histidine kinase CheA/ActR/RegA family two-component response regulator
MQPEQQQRIMGYFIEEAKDHLNTIEQGLLNLQSTISDPEAINEVFRAAHSVKGGAAMLGLTSIQKTAHRLEDYFKILKEAPGIKPDQKIESLLLQVFDTLQELLEQLQLRGSLDEEASNAAMAKVQPVFEELEHYFVRLEQQAQSGGDKGTVIQAGVVEDNAIVMIFQNDVPAQLREMLQLFRQAEALSDGRDRLIELARALKGLGDALDLKTWSKLLETVEGAIANSNNSYRTVAPIVIKELKHAQDLVLTGRTAEIAASDELKALLPAAAPAIDADLANFFAVADGEQSTESFDLGDFNFATSEAPELDLSDFDLGATESSELDLSDFDLAVTSAESATADEVPDLNLDSVLDLPELEESEDLADLFNDRNGPEVGMAELNSLADLFEGEVPELGSTWQQEEVLPSPSAAVVEQNGSLDSENTGDFSDLLDTDLPATSKAASSDDLSSLFGDDMLEAFDAPTAQSSTNDFDIPDFGSASELETIDLSMSDSGDFADLNLNDFNALENGTQDLSKFAGKGDLEEAVSSLDNLGELFAGLDDEDLNFGVAASEPVASSNGEANLNGLDFNGILDASDNNSLELEVTDDFLLGLSDLSDASDAPELNLDDAFGLELEGTAATADSFTDLGLDLEGMTLSEAADPLADLVLEETTAPEAIADPWNESELIGASDLELPSIPSESDLETLDLSLDLGSDLLGNFGSVETIDLDLGADSGLEGLLADIPASEVETLDLGVSDRSTSETLDSLLDFSITEDELQLDSDLNAPAADLADLDFGLGDIGADLSTNDGLGDLQLDDLVEAPEATGQEDDLTMNLGLDDLDMDTLAPESLNGSFDQLEASEEIALPELELDGLFGNNDALDLNLDSAESNGAASNVTADADLNDLLGSETLDLGLSAAASDFELDDLLGDTTGSTAELDLSLDSADSLDFDLGEPSRAVDAVDSLDDLLGDIGVAEEDSLDLSFGEVEEATDLDDLLSDVGMPEDSDDTEVAIDTLLTEESLDLDNLNISTAGNDLDNLFGSDDSAELLGVEPLADTSLQALSGFDQVVETTSSDDELDLFGLGISDESSTADLDLTFGDLEVALEAEESTSSDELDLLGLGLSDQSDDADLDLTFGDLAASSESDELGDLDALLSDEAPVGKTNGFSPALGAGVAAASIAGLGAAFVAHQTKDEPIVNLEENGVAALGEFADLDNLLSDDIAADDDSLDGFLDEDPLSVSADDLGDLDALLNDAPSTAIASEGFDDLESLLADAPDAVPVTNFAASGGESDPEFDDLEKMLEDADKTMGGTPTVKSRAAAPAGRRSTRPNKGFSEQTMRVPVKHLDNLSNLVGELVVNRNSLEQDQERLRQSLDNLLYQVQQLSDVGQRMQDLYERSLLESSLLASRQNHRVPFGTSDRNEGNGTSPTGVEYDPLEMDRFTGFHSLSQEMIELIVRVRESSSDIEFIVDETEQVTRMFRQVTTQLQEGLTRSRMVPFAQTADRLPRAVRDIALKCGKQAELVIEGRDTLIDKMILEHLYDPMTHLVNNAITHGIESPETRVSNGKAPTGQITIRAFHQGNQTVISVSDDGGGVDVETVRRKAIEKGLITAAEAQTMSRLDIYDLLFHPGFSTKDQADDFAGRGVGMDVVRTSLSEIRGAVTTDSVQGKGTTFTIRLPLTLSISKALCCISDRARIAFPMDGVEDMLDLPKERIQTNAEGQPMITWRDTVLPLRPLNDLLTHNRHLSRGTVYGTNQEDDMVSIVVLRSAGNYLALQVDQVLGEQEIVIKQLEGPVPKPIGIAGATVLGDGRIMPIADVLELIDLSMGRIRREVGTMWDQGAGQPNNETVTTKTEPMVLIVDDSITVRELLSMTFNKVGYRVEQARDGQEAWEKLRAGLPCDIVFCDIEMPRMDGLELLSRIQKDPNLSNLPIAMLTSRGADRHRQMAVSLGASGYFTKPYLEEALLDAAQRMLKGEVLISSSGS